jgi:hypothetical protein
LVNNDDWFKFNELNGLLKKKGELLDIDKWEHWTLKIIIIIIIIIEIL